MITPEQRRAHRKFHDLLRAEKGPASDHSCVDCDKPAQEWSWDKGSGENFGTKSFGDSFDEYSPRCRSCHRKMDAAGWNHSPETIEKMRAAKIGRPLSEEHRDSIRKSLTGKTRKPFSKEWRENMVAAQQRRRARERGETG